MLHESSLDSDQDYDEIGDRAHVTRGDSNLSSSSSTQTDTSVARRRVCFRHRVSFKMIPSRLDEKAATNSTTLGCSRMTTIERDELLQRARELELEIWGSYYLGRSFGEDPDETIPWE
eukprot:CAMPEP_0169061372 /NCGR_PEP_ID=MMETSP1015-20121227/73_1 /TAXON_ID=342587 /ORGANISM="Karlodinium micrum, Strain CCMP2283" /LENGTH=117 /DNA_ID=CAMNT_0009119351 /DNA_START=115 /DNA_END=468 /DNA_ORIENTATION=-